MKRQRIRYYLQAQIVNPPRDILQYCKSVGRQLRTAETQMDEARELWTRLKDKHDFLDDLSRAFRWASPEISDSTIESSLNLGRYLRISELAETLDAAVAHNNRNFIGYYTRGVADLDFDRWQPMIDSLTVTHIPEVFEENGLTTEYPKETKTYLKMVDLLREVTKVVPVFLTSLKKLEADSLSRKEGYRPDTEKQEILFHASAFAAEIAREGFKAEPPLARTGLGWFGGTAKLTSFTHDIKLARDIMRALREFTMIANGELKASRILEWCRTEKIDIDLGTINRRNLTDPWTPEQTAELYNYYLWTNKVKRTNPVFTGYKDLIKLLKGRSVKDVGIIQATVLMDSAEYFVTEREYRVPASSILDFKRIQ